MKKVRLGVIGLGLIGKIHAKTLQEVDACTLAAVCDADENARKTAQEIGATYYSDYKQMIEAESFAYTRDSLKECAKTAEDLGVNIFLEPINRFMGDHLFKTIPKEISLIEAVDSPRVRLIRQCRWRAIDAIKLVSPKKTKEGETL